MWQPLLPLALLRAENIYPESNKSQVASQSVVSQKFRDKYVGC